MTREDVLKVVKECGFVLVPNSAGNHFVAEISTDKLERFAAAMYAAGCGADLIRAGAGNELTAANEQIRKLEDFKSYTHQRLDEMGVPHSIPESEHDKAGCRVGGRFDWVEAKLTAANERIRELEAECERERLRLAACGTAALGYFDGCKNEYKSASLDDVLRLRGMLTAEREVSDKLERALKYIMEWQVGNVDKWHNRAYDSASKALSEVAAIRDQK